MLSEKVTSTRQTAVMMPLPLEGTRGRPAFPVEASDNPRRITPAILGGVLRFGWAGSIFGFPCSSAAAATVCGSRSCGRPVSTATYEQCDTRLSICPSLPHLQASLALQLIVTGRTCGALPLPIRLLRISDSPWITLYSFRNPLPRSARTLKRHALVSNVAILSQDWDSDLNVRTRSPSDTWSLLRPQVAQESMH